MNKTGTGAVRLTVILFAGLLLFAGCKDPLQEEPEKPKEYTVTFDAVGGSPAIQTKMVTDGYSVGSSNMPSDPTRSGYTFTGWYTAVSGGSEFIATTIVTGDITVYARWSLDAYTVTFDAAGGSPATQTRTVMDGSSVGSSGMPSEPTRSGYIFNGWYTAASGGSVFTAAATVTANITVYARWTAAVMPDNLSLADALTWIDNNAITGNTYAITLRNNETIAPKTLSYSGKTVGITLTSGTMERTVSLNAIGSLFTVGSRVTLTLGNNVTLQGRRDNTDALVQVNSDGTLVMNTGSKISGNSTSPSSDGGGVYVRGGTFTMNGGTISGNSASSFGGGVYAISATFTMSDGTISGNSALSSGGGVLIGGGTFTMNGGTISGNTAPQGGGVYTTGTTFTMSNGTISGNTASSWGGGVCTGSGTTFTMSNGTISGNTASDGGGVHVGGTFTMNGGTISGNTVSYSASPAGGWGGGVHVSITGTFTKQSGGVIYGSNESDSALRNTAAQGDTRGHAVYVSVYDSPAKRRNTTAGTGVTLDSSVSGSAGGWE